jgi:hypothetical protein
MLIAKITAARRSLRPALCSVIGSMVLLCGASHVEGAGASPPTDQLPPSNSQPLDEVIVSARKFDRRALEHVIIPQFVKSRGAASERIGQIGRWREIVCPATSGLKNPYAEFVSRRVVEVARSVGAPTKRAGDCQTNVVIIFTPRPQELLNYLGRRNKSLLGYSERGDALARFSHTIEARYVTGTRSFTTNKPTMTFPDTVSDSVPHFNPPEVPLPSGLQIDSDSNLIEGRAGSWLGNGITSEFVRVTVIADTRALVRYPLREVADYIALLALTRTALDGCNPLPSIIDLFSADCGTRARPGSMTEADTAYLKALYSSNLELNLNIERGEIRDHVLKVLEGP